MLGGVIQMAIQQEIPNGSLPSTTGLGSIHYIEFMFDITD
jgi:hypothetical protein